MRQIRRLSVLILFASPALFAQNMQITQLPAATVGAEYKVSLKMQVTTPFQLTVSAGQLPDGLELNPVGIIQGTPARAGKQLFVVTVTDSDNQPRDMAFSISVTNIGQPASQSGSNQDSPIQSRRRLIKNATAKPQEAVLRAPSTVLKAAKQPVKATTRSDSLNIAADQKDQSDDSDQANDDDYKNYDERMKLQIVGGVEQGGVASLPNQTNAFLNLFTSGGFDSSPFKMWGRIRLLGSPTASTGGVISAFQDPTGQIKNLDTQKVGQAVDFVFGPEFRLSPDNKRYSVHFIGGFGATTPLSSEDVVNKFKVPVKGSQQCGQVISRFTPENGYPANLILPDPTGTNCLANGITVLAFNRQERTSFLRKYGVGIRTITRFRETDRSSTTGKACCERGVVDFVFGQDEAITGGKLHGWVFRVDGVHPLPIAGKSYLYLFGTASIRITHNKDLRTLILDADTSGATPSAANVALLPLKQPDKDFYRFGVGLDFVKMIKGMTGTDKKQPANK